MSANEGPSRSDFKKSRELPDCGAHCEHIHGDQVSPDDVVIDGLRARVRELEEQVKVWVDKHRSRVDDIEALKALIRAAISAAEQCLGEK